MTKKQELLFSVFLFISCLLFFYSFINPSIIVVIPAFIFSLLALRLHRKKYPKINKNYQDIVEERRGTKIR